MNDYALESLGKLKTRVQVAQIDVKFENLSYFVKVNLSEKKQILNNINGHFFPGELTAILGANGSGKTSLLNILAGFASEGVSGKIEVNNKIRNIQKFRLQAAYVTQDDCLPPLLTVREEIAIAAKLKLGNLSSSDQVLVVNETIKLYGLNDCADTRVEKISGGERKRLAIAIELTSDPQILFIDEPTSGLDAVTINLIVNILKAITEQGKTVICTLNQPSVALLNNFRQVYFVARGQCIYNGTPANILPFLSSLEQECPITYSHSEYIIETVEITPYLIPSFVKAIENGKINKRDLDDASKSVSRDGEARKSFTPSFWIQFSVIYKRMMLQQVRNKMGLFLQLFHHVVCGLMLGLTFLNIGNNGKLVISNYYFCWITLTYFFFTYILIPVTSFPFELEIIKREYLNRWYGYNAYYLAVSLKNVPIMVAILGLVFAIITFCLTGQTMELDRITKYFLICILSAFLGDSLGLIIGSTCSVLMGLIVAPLIFSPVVLISLYGFGHWDIVSDAMKIVISMSYVRQGIAAMLLALLENGPKFYCEVGFSCLFKYPSEFLYRIGISDKSYGTTALILLCFIAVFRIIAYAALRYKLNSEEPVKNVSYITQLLFQH